MLGSDTITETPRASANYIHKLLSHAQEFGYSVIQHSVRILTKTGLGVVTRIRVFGHSVRILTKTGLGVVSITHIFAFFSAYRQMG